ncbi:MAG: sigma factor-like helix-turn-helix DNA-binding protein [Actinomycetota bacterium]
MGPVVKPRIRDLEDRLGNKGRPRGRGIVPVSWEPGDLDKVDGTPLWQPDSFDPLLKERIREAVDDLPDIEREVVSLWFWGQYRPSEIAREIGRTRQYVNYALSMALPRLRKALSDE